MLKNLADTAIIRSGTKLRIGKNVLIMDYCIIGELNPYPDVFLKEAEKVVSIGDNTIIYPYSVLYEGASVGDSVRIGERCTIGSRTKIGHHCRLVYGAQIHDNVTVGGGSIVGGFIADNCAVGESCHVFGSLVHRYDLRASQGWDETDERGPTLGDNVLVGWGAVLVGPIRIGTNARIKPNAVVVSDIALGGRND